MKTTPTWSLVCAERSAQRTQVCLSPCHSPKSFPNDSRYSGGLQCPRTLLHTNTDRKLRDPTLGQPSCCSEKFIHPFHKPILSLPARRAHSEGLGTTVTELPSGPRPHGAFSLVRNEQSGSVRLLVESIRITWIFLKSFTGKASPITWGPQPFKDSECCQGWKELNLPIWKGNSWHRVLSAHQPSRKGGEKSRASQRWLPEQAISRHKSSVLQDLPTTPVHFYFTLSRWAVGFLTLVSLNYIILNIWPFVHRHQE